MHKDGGITAKAFLLPVLLLSFFGILLWPLQSTLPVLFHTEIFGNKGVILVGKQSNQNHGSVYYSSFFCVQQLIENM